MTARRWSPRSTPRPEPIELSALFGRMKDHGCRGVAMEVSSHGIHQKRIAAIGFDACVFTNLTQDHLDYHGTIEAYYQAKAEWFHALAADPHGKKPVAVINIDDACGADLAAALERKLPVIALRLRVSMRFPRQQFPPDRPRHGIRACRQGQNLSWCARR